MAAACASNVRNRKTQDGWKWKKRKVPKKEQQIDEKRAGLEKVW